MSGAPVFQRVGERPPDRANLARAERPTFSRAQRFPRSAGATPAPSARPGRADPDRPYASAGRRTEPGLWAGAQADGGCSPEAAMQVSPSGIVHLPQGDAHDGRTLFLDEGGTPGA